MTLATNELHRWFISHGYTHEPEDVRKELKLDNYKITRISDNIYNLKQRIDA